MAFDEFMGGGRSQSFQFYAPGDKVRGVIVDMKQTQQTDMDTGQPKFFPNGQPRLMWVVTLQTQLRRGEGLKDYDPADGEDDGIRTIYLKWKSEEAVKAAVKAAGARAPEVGGDLEMVFAKFGPKQGNFPTKLYTATYQPPDPGAAFMVDSPPSRLPAQQEDFGRVSQPQGGFAPSPAGTPPAWGRQPGPQPLTRAQQAQMDEPPF